VQKKQQLDTLLVTYNLTCTVYFPTRIKNGAASALDNIFIDVSKNGNYTICPLVNGLSDHDAQILKLNNLNTQGQYNEIQIIRSFNKQCITNFKIKLSFETWDNILGGNYVNIIFNNFLNTYLRIFYSCVPGNM
jgi:hypothetical protein